MSTPETPGKPGLFRKMGFGSLTISILVHGVLVILGFLFIVKTIHHDEKKDVDFLSRGGGGGSPGTQITPQKHKAVQMPPANPQRVFAEGAVSTLTIEQTDNPTPISSLQSLDSGGLSGGLGGSGSGGGKGDGNGRGFGSGSGLGTGGNAGSKPFAGLMFGNPVAASTIGVVLDVSGSMLPHLPKVIQELDRVAEGSPLILYVGCGIGSGRAVDRSYPTIDIDQRRFERFWRITHDPAYADHNTLEKGSAKVKVDFSTPIPHEAIYRILATRQNTAYIDYQGTKFAWTGLLAKELRAVEAVYWFADFKDAVDEKEADDIMRRLRAKKQKLYIHPSVEGPYVGIVRDEIVQPTGGSVIVVK